MALPDGPLTGAGVPRVGLGLAALGRPAYITSGRAGDLPSRRSVDTMEARTHEVLDAAWDAGVRYVDCARSYGLAERFLGSWLASHPGRRERLVVGSKWGYRYVGEFRVDAAGHGPLRAGPVWDFDRTMGCAADSRAEDPNTWGNTGGVGFFDYGFYGGLFKDPAFRARYWDRLGQLLKGPLSPERTAAFIDEAAAQLEEAAARNFARWGGYPPRGSYANEVKILKDWVAARAAFMNGCIQREDPLSCPM